MERPAPDGDAELSPPLNFARLALVSLVGALILEVILTVAVGFSRAFTLDQVPAHLAAVLIGSLGGWLFEMLREITLVTQDAIRSVNVLQATTTALTTKIRYQDTALGMLTRSPRHNASLTVLIQTSMSENFRNIPLVGVPAYLSFLKLAIEHSSGYEGVQRRPLRWYRETGAGSYLSDLRNRQMDYKRRLFVIDDAEADLMREDLADDATMAYYWDHTGEVSSHWLTVSEFQSNFPGRRAPRDHALYDRQLLICYDERAQLLTFDVIDDASPEVRLFEAILGMATHEVAALKPIPGPAHGRARGRVPATTPPAR